MLLHLQSLPLILIPLWLQRKLLYVMLKPLNLLFKSLSFKFSQLRRSLSLKILQRMAVNWLPSVDILQKVWLTSYEWYKPKIALSQTKNFKLTNNSFITNQKLQTPKPRNDTSITHQNQSIKLWNPTTNQKKNTQNPPCTNTNKNQIQKQK